MKIVLALVVIAALAGGGFSVCEYVDHRGKIKQSEQACGALNDPTSGVVIPSGLAFTLPTGQTLLTAQEQGKTAILLASLAGGRKDLVSIRDAVVSALKMQGYSAAATDQEPTYEAEGKFGVPVRGSINVQPLCASYDKVRYTFNR